jgi:hypothetical protein
MVVAPSVRSYGMGMPGQLNDTAGSRITDPFAVVTDLPSVSPSTSNNSTASNGCPSDAPSPSMIINRVMQATKGGNKRTLATLSSNLSAAASSILKQQRFIPTDDARANQRNDFGLPADTDAHARAQLTMPQHINLHEVGLC